MSARKLKNGKWKTEVWYKNRRICSKTFSTKALAEKFERSTLQELELKELTGSQAQNYSYDEIYNFWYSDASQRKRSTSLEKDRQMNRDFVSPEIGQLRINEISSLHFQRIVNKMITSGLSKSSTNKVIEHFKAVFNYSYSNELIARNPSKNVKKFKLPKKEMKYLSKEYVDKLLTYTHHKYQGEERWKHVLYLTFFLTGERLGEVLGLQWSQIHFEEDAILVNQIWCSKEHKIVDTTKGKKDLRLPMNSYLKKELASIRNSRKGEFIFSQNGDRPIDASNFRSRIWFKDLEEAGIPRIRIHDSRHTYASLFMMSGGDIYDLKMLLNHSTVAMTEKYAKLSPKHLAKVKDLITINIQSDDNVIDVFSNKWNEKTSSLNPAHTVEIVDCV
jgi:site-specific recombinase XerD